MEDVERIPPTELSYPSVDEELVGEHFDVQAWCSVGQVYNVRKLSLEILKQTGGDRFVNVDDPDDMVRKHLFGKRYLIVLDDLWESNAWDDLHSCFPSWETGSRIMVKTRNVELTRYMSWRSDPYLLPFLRDEESWELLQKKVFQGESCPLELRSVGTLVDKQCKGLPFLIIMIAGILSRKEREASTWLEVAYDIGSHALEEGSMKMMQSSYDFLPDCLKPCLLYMGLFPKGYEIPVSDLLKWWIAEEFVPNIGTLEQEETSMSSLSDLVSRNLFIRVLHLLDFYLDNSWAAAFRSLIHLRYLAIFVKAFHFKWVSHLVHLQTLGVCSSYIMMSPAIWKLEKLRHVDINEFPIRWEDGERVKFEETADVVLHNLKTLGTCFMSVADMTPKFWNKFPNLEQLRLHIDEFGDVPYYSDSRLMALEMFPSRLRNLSLSETFLTDEIVSSIAKLQHLETLKLSEIYFTGEKHWDLSDNTFEELKFLKLHRVFMIHWYCSDESFPSLKYLVIKSCSKLEEIPLSFVEVPTLQLIKIIDCSNSVGDSALKIEKEMEEYDCELQVHILKND
ncbi:putative mediator of RNA polymerase II transcription subunit 25-like [Capsicum annuum]|nr:putative mediator of RNA polymerase II transcription subunit 25-like [Capsicum annuum]